MQIYQEMPSSNIYILNDKVNFHFPFLYILQGMKITRFLVCFLEKNPSFSSIATNPRNI